MSNRDELANAVAAFYETRNSARPEDVLRLLDPTCSFRIVGTDKLGPFTQMVNTPETVERAAKVLFENWDLSGLRVVSLHVDGDTVFAHRAGTVRYIPGGTSFDTEILDKITFKDGLIVEFLQFADTFHVAQVAGLGHQ